MSFVPLLILLLLLGGAISSFFVARPSVRYAYAIGSTVLGVSLLIWLVAGQYLPLEFVLSNWPAASRLPSWTLRVDSIAWQLSFYSLLLSFAAISAQSMGSGREALGSEQVEASSSLPSLYQLLMATALVTVWSDSLAGLAVGWVAMDISWVAFLWGGGEERMASRSSLLRLSAPLLSLLLLWTAMISSPNLAGTTLDSQPWPVLTTILALLASALRLGVFPLYWWRPLYRMYERPSSALIHIIPAVGGSTLLIRLVLSDQTNSATVLLLTALGMVGLLAGVSFAWSHIGEPLRLAIAVTICQASFIVLATTWLGPAAALAETRVLVLAAGGMFLAAPLARQRSAWATVGPLLSVAALIGVPFTASFASRAALYSSWLENGRIVLVLVTGIMYALLIGAIVLTSRSAQLETNQPPELPTHVWLQRTLPTLLLAMGLVVIADLVAGRPAFSGWLVSLLSAASGLGLSHVVGQTRTAPAALRGLLHPTLPWQRLAEIGKSSLTHIGRTIREATAILEGEGGMLWLILLIVVFWLARRG